LCSQREYGPVLWTPSPEQAEAAAITRFMRETGHADYHSLWRWSVEDLDGFWRALWDFFHVEADGDASTVLASREMPGASWFPGVRLSYAEHVFRDRPQQDVAIVHRGETGAPATWTWADLRAETARIRAGLRTMGVGPGDRIAAYMPNVPQAVAALLAAASLGAIWTSCSPDFGVRAVIDRFAQVEPKVLLAVDGYRYGGREFERGEVVAELRAALPSLEHTVVLPLLGEGDSWSAAFPPTEEPLRFERVPFDHPLWVLYSSGTTGLPKPLVHGHGGILLEHLKKLALHVDAREGDRVFWFTTTGWMMWNFLISALLTGAAIVLYDGDPARDDMAVLWDLAEEAETTCFGVGAAFIHRCMKSGIEPRRGRDLSSVRAVGSTGSPLSPDGFRWIYDHVGDDVWLFSTSGGTDLCTSFVGGVPVLPVHLGELQARSLGADVQAFDDEGEAVVDEVGELVIAQPMPSMPVCFWNDPDGRRYRESYFSAFPGVWRHGDWIRITSRGTAVIYGRSDATINRGGVRMGTAEIYRAAMAVDEVVDALAVDLPPRDDAGDSWLGLFVVMREEACLTDSVADSLRRRIREDCSPRHVPNDVIEVPELPRTLSGKVLELPVKRILMGAEPATAVSRDSLANPSALDWFIDYARRRA
jgi:acetoacetyl-CoA synthetase